MSFRLVINSLNNICTDMFNHHFSILAVVLVALYPLQTSLAYDLEWNQIEAKIDLKPGEQEAKAEFIMTNHGESAVRIDHIKTSCGCTGSILDKKTINPGESATIIGTFKKGNRNGLNRNRLQVFLEGDSQPVETLYMFVQIPQLMKVLPSIVYWNRSSNKTERSLQIELNTDYLNKISSIEYDADLLTVTEKQDDSGQFDLVLTILPKSFDKQLRTTILIKAIGENDLSAEKKVQVFVQP